MTPGIYSAVSGLSARWSQQDLSAKNISSVGTSGHKRQISAFSAFENHLNASLNNEQQPGAIVPLSINQGPVFDFSQGALRQTGAPMDVAIDGQGFFEVETAAGKRLTRNGHFHINQDQRLVDDSNSPVMGTRGEITISDKNATVKITRDGTIMAGSQEIDQLRVVVPKDYNKLQSEGGTLFTAEGTPVEDAKSTQLAVGALEASNVELPVEMTQMIQNQRMYDMLTRAIALQDESMGRLIQDSAGS